MLSSPPSSARHSSPEELLEPLRKKVKLDGDATSDPKTAMGIALKQSKLQGLPAVRAQYEPLIPPALKVSTIACSFFLFCSVLCCAVVFCSFLFHLYLSFLP
jgi:hypothetical protein